MTNERCTECKYADQLETQLAEAQKQNAAMRDALFGLLTETGDKASERTRNEANAALCPNAGKDYLHRSEVEPLVKALKECDKTLRGMDGEPSVATEALAIWGKLKSERGWK